MHRTGLFIATAGYAGYAPFAPGTAGSAVGLVLTLLARSAGGTGAELVVILAVLVVGVWSGGVAERHYGRKDPGPVVIDEVLGQMLTLVLLPVGTGGLVAGFLVFRIFDVIKPWPANRLEALPRGFGIMADDAMAGVYSHLVLRGLAWLAPSWML